MNRNNTIKPAYGFKVNQADPRFHQQFLQFSHDMYQWRQHVNDETWWRQREQACLMLFENNGYDLLTGGWYCLIKLQRSGWRGISKSTLLLAHSFNGGQPMCWPPQTAKLLRRQVLDNYAQQVLPLFHQLPGDRHVIDVRKPLLSALVVLENHAKRLQCQHVNTLRLVIETLKSVPTVAKRQVNKRVESGNLATITTPNSAEASSTLAARAKPKHYFVAPRTFLIGAVIGAVLALSSTQLLPLLKAPTFLALSNEIWPNNPWYTACMRQYQQMSQSVVENNSLQMLVTLLDGLEQRLIASEQRTQPYMTVSQLKTSIYHARQLVAEQRFMIENQLNSLQIKKQQHLAISAAERHELQQRIQALNAKLMMLDYQ